MAVSVRPESKRFDELDHSTTLIGIWQRAAHRAGIVRHDGNQPSRHLAIQRLLHYLTFVLPD
jgi:hypothetical protein